MASVLVDTGPLYAIADRDDDWHDRTVPFSRSQSRRFGCTSKRFARSSYLLAAHLGAAAERQLVQSVLNGELAVKQLIGADLRRALELLRQYEKARIGFVDATVIAVAERLKIPRILTTARRDFSLIRPRHCKAFDLLP